MKERGPEDRKGKGKKWEVGLSKAAPGDWEEAMDWDTQKIKHKKGKSIW